MNLMVLFKGFHSAKNEYVLNYTLTTSTLFQGNEDENKSFTFNEKYMLLKLDGHECEIFTLNEKTSEDEKKW